MRGPRKARHEESSRKQNLNSERPLQHISPIFPPPPQKDWDMRTAYAHSAKPVSVMSTKSPPASTRVSLRMA